MATRLSVIVAAFWWALGAQASIGQGTVPLRAVYRGEFLPEGTEIVVLTREGRVQQHGRFQPEFFPTSDFPTSGPQGLRKDRLDENGRSSRQYPRTGTSGDLYFLYALTPDSTLFWSYSAERDALKFDVVSSGVMSVAPISDPGAARQILRAFFSPRVIVYMPDLPPSSSSGPPDTIRSTNDGDVAFSASEEDGSDAELISPHAPEERSSGFREDGERIAQGHQQSSAGIGPADRAGDPGSHIHATSGVGLPEGPVSRGGSRFASGPVSWIAGALLLLLGGALGAALTARAYRREVRSLRSDTRRLRDALRKVAEITGSPPHN